jgi:acetolactate synthase-1/2/3 large subunit
MAPDADPAAGASSPAKLPPTYGDLLLDYLQLEGVSHIFGIPGGGVAGMLDLLTKRLDSLTYVVSRHETGAAYMADGYYRVSGKLGTVLVTTGPGATNALTGVSNADAAGSAMLVLTGEIQSNFFGMGYLQEGIDGSLDVNAVFRASCGSSAVLVNSTSNFYLIESALRTAMSVPRRAAHLSLPVDVTMTKPVLPLPPSPPPPSMPTRPQQYRGAPPVAPADSISAALSLLAAAKRPLILIGNGCREALRDKATAKALLDFVTRHSIPVITTADGKGLLPDDHPLSLRTYGLANCIWPYQYMMQKDPVYDALLVIGSGLGEMATDKWISCLQPNGVMIQLDANPHILARDYNTDLAIAGEAGDFIRRLQAGALHVQWNAQEAKDRAAKVALIKSTLSPFQNEQAYLSESAPIHPAALCRVMQENLPARDTILMLDSCNSVGWGLHYLVAKPGFDTHASLDMGPMGFAVGAVIGAKLARPEATCVALTGDGAFMMHGAEISTAKRYGVGAIWIVLQDDDLGMVTQGLSVAYKDVSPSVWEKMFNLGSPDLVAFATGLGADAVAIDRPAQLAVALKAALKGAKAGRPQVIVAKVDRAAVPPYYTPPYIVPKSTHP